MDPVIYLLTLCLPLLTVLLVVAIRNVSAVLQARARAAQDEAYRRLAAEAAQAQADANARLAEMGALLARLEARTASVERILKQVE